MANYAVKDLISKIKKEDQKARSCWAHGVACYAIEILEALECENISFSTVNELKNLLLNGAKDWRTYSWGGCSLIYNVDICERLASKSEQKKRNYGSWRPNKYEDWLDVQARGLYQACNLIKKIIFC